MNFNTTFKLSTFIAAVSVVVFLWAKFDLGSTGCQQLAKRISPNTNTMVSTCTQLQQTSWFSWLTGQSRSTQFHFIDLLELLSRFQSKSSE